MKRFIFFIILTLTALLMQAQTNVSLTYDLQSDKSGVKEYAKEVGVFFARPEIKTEKKKTTAVWHGTNMDWIKDYCDVKNVAIEKDYLKYFPEMAGITEEQPYIPLSWRLTEENNETVLHCYFPMPADEVSNLFLASEETSLVDQETGVQYRIRRTEPDTYNKHFTVRAKKGDVLDLKIFFAPLPETTKDIKIYGVSCWNMMGMPVKIGNQYYGTVEYYDTIPQFHSPRLLKEHMSVDKPYDMQDWNTWKVLTDAHLIKPIEDETLALWRTPDAANFNSGTALLDKFGRPYKLRKILGTPLDELFFMNGNAGDHIAFLMEFEPLPLDVQTITFVEPDIEPFNAWGANNKGIVLSNLNVKQLLDNQKLFEYCPRIVVK